MKPVVVRAAFVYVCALILAGSVWHVLHAAALTQVSDLLSTSVPGATSTHTIQFRATQAIPPSGRIVITPHAGRFSIPAGFDYTDVDMAVSDGGPYVDRPLDSASTTADTVTVVTGLSGSITVTLTSGDGIAAGDRVQIELGDNATHGEVGDLLIENPQDDGSYGVLVATRDASDAALDGARAMVAIVLPVSTSVQNENEPPLRSNGLPSGEVAAGNERIEISLQTNEIADCRYSTTPDIPYASMTNVFTTVGTKMLHYTTLSGFQNNLTYTYYVRCKDFYDTVNDDDYEIQFSLAPDPISDTSIPDESSGSAEDTIPGPIPDGSDFLYRSKVAFSGFSSPQSSVVILKDGTPAVTAQTGSDGAFSTSLTGLERGSYTFLAYTLDRSNRKSSAHASTLSLGQGTENNLSDIVIPPTIGVESDTVEVGTEVIVAGEAVPNSTIELSMVPTKGGVAKNSRAVAGADGAWEHSIGATELARGTYRLRARAIVSSLLRSDQSAIVLLGVGESPSEEEEEPAPTGTTDINGDGKVNLVDFSIMLSSWGTGDAGSDFNGDGTVNLADFSILLFNWTG